MIKLVALLAVKSIVKDIRVGCVKIGNNSRGTEEQRTYVRKVVNSVVKATNPEEYYRLMNES
ncbi:hypothetical protein FACS1894132_04740 [Clostridia bacterium]|nr:hypothetical protein FACS1894132_04740 [Clostridia bacterium]